MNGPLLAGLAVAVILALGIRRATFHPRRIQTEKIFSIGTAPRLKPGQRIKVLCWNVQFMAGKNYLFWFDLLDLSGPDIRPTKADIASTIESIARVIRQENPDVVLLQEVADGHAAADHEDQLARLLSLLPAEYVCHASAFYVKAPYVPHPKIRGSVGIKLSIVSKFQIGQACRHQLSRAPGDPLTRLFVPRRAILETRLPIEPEGELALLNTHLDALAQGTETMLRQVREVDGLLDGLDRAGLPWVFGGDFNLLPPIDEAYERLAPSQKEYYKRQSEIAPLFERRASVPSLAELSAEEAENWFTHFPNDRAPSRLDKTLDYLFFADSLRLGVHYVRQEDTRRLSDHMPLVSEFILPE